MSLRIVPTSLAEANQFVSSLHRHHKPMQGHKFSIACVEGEEIKGVAIVGRPVNRTLDDGWTLEVTRCCTDGTRNACSILYGRAARVAKELGYLRIGTYTRQDESGASLRAVGWQNIRKSAGGTWVNNVRLREDRTELFPRIYWLKELQ